MTLTFPEIILMEKRAVVSAWLAAPKARWQHASVWPREYLTRGRDNGPGLYDMMTRCRFSRWGAFGTAQTSIHPTHRCPRDNFLTKIIRQPWQRATCGRKLVTGFRNVLDSRKVEF